MTALIFLAAPANGAAVHYQLAPSEALRSAFEFAPKLHAIKDGQRVIDGSLIGGLVSFPSYHAAVAALLSWAAWPTLARWPVIALNAGMLLGSAIFGGHYFVDLIAGAMLAAAAIALARRALA